MLQTSNIVGVILVAGCVLCQDISDLSKFLGPQIGSSISNFEGFSLNNQDVFTCENASDFLTGQSLILNTCLSSHLNYSIMQEELEEAKNIGNVDNVVVKYCKKYPQIYECLENFADQLIPCLEPAQHKNVYKILGFFDVIKEYACYSDGLRVSLFVAFNGTECMQSRMEELQNCFNGTTWATRISNMSTFTVPEFEIAETECKDLSNIRTCACEQMKKCDPSMPANVVDAFFKFLSKKYSCKRIRDDSLFKNNQENLTRLLILVVSFIAYIGLIYILAKK